MKTRYTLFLAAAVSLLSTAANSQVVSVCNDPAGGIQIRYDYALNCPNSPGSFVGLDSLGFHSGANGWASVVEWDKPQAVKAYRYADQKYVVRIPSPNTYYGVSTTAINWVFNQGATQPNAPWEAEGKKDNGNGGCDDFFVDLLSVTETCSALVGTRESLSLDKAIAISPNPVTDQTTIAFDNAEGAAYRIQLHNALGQVVRDLHHFTGERLEWSLVDQSAGIYTLTLTDEAGKFASRLLVVE